jgi:two-component system chemotaxis sensor kinase CheA
MIDLSLLEDFISGAGESLDEMEAALLELEINPNNNELLHTIFRAIHTIKGAAQFVGLEKVSALSHVLEDLLDELREGKRNVTPEIIDLLIHTKDRLSQLVIDLEKTKTEICEVDDLISTIKLHFDETPETNAPPELEETAELEMDDVDLSAFLEDDWSEQSEIDLAAFLSEDQHISESEPKPEPESIETSSRHEYDVEDISIPEEEYDQELFGIYIQQLKEKASQLQDAIAQLTWADNKAELLNTAASALESLKFASNYMGYEQLTHFYSRWLEQLWEAKEEYVLDSAVSLAFMSDYLLKLQHIFPQLADNIAPPQQFMPVEAEPESALEQAADTAIDSLSADDASLAFLADFLAPEESKEPTPEPEPNVLEDEDYLFAKLSHALDSSIERAITSEPINEVFSALLTANNAHNAQKAELPPLKIKTLEEANQEPEPELEPQLPAVEAITEQAQPANKTEKVTAPNTDKALKKSIRVDADKIDSLMNQVGELIVDRAYFFQLASEINELQQYLKGIGLAQKDLKPVRTFAYRFSEAIISLGRTSNELQEGVMKVRMLPISQLFNRYPRLVHDLAHTNDKKVQLEIRGEETELDKMIIEEISDPLIHMIRNAIGHGIETPEVRKQLGKPEIGTLILEAYHESNHIVIEVTDDGKGIDTDKIKAKAEEMKLFSADELNRMSPDDLTRFVMLPGFSTAKQIDSTSGRGVGMDVVKKNIEKLNGTIEVESIFGVETRIRLKIPLTLAIIQALLVRVGEDSYTIPLANVEETLRVTHQEISLVEDTEVMHLRGRTLPIFRLSVLFNLHSTQPTEQQNCFVVVVNTGNQKVGLMVDALLGQEEVVIKPLVDYLHEQNCFSGATIIGDGRISLILDVYELINIATEKQVRKHQEQERRSLASLEGSA